MAKTSYIEKSGVKAMPWSTFFTRTSNNPFDRSSIFGSYEDALKYAAGNEQNPDSRNLVTASYIGQIVTVYENDDIKTYYITAERKLQEIGRSSVVFTSTNKEIEDVSYPLNEGTFIFSTVAYDAQTTPQEIKKLKYQGPGLYLITKTDNTVELKLMIATDIKGNTVFDCGTF